jgi:hypothetical protein
MQVALAVAWQFGSMGDGSATKTGEPGPREGQGGIAVGPILPDW